MPREELWAPLESVASLHSLQGHSALPLCAHCLHRCGACWCAGGRAKERWAICDRRAHVYRETHRRVGVEKDDVDFLSDTLLLHVFARVSARRAVGDAISVCLQACWGAVAMLALVRWELVLVVAQGEVLCWLRSVLFSGASRLAEASSLIALGTSRRSEDCGLG